MQPTPYILPAAANYQVLAGNHVPPVVDAAGNTFWALNVKKGSNPFLYFAVFLQLPTGEAREVLAFTVTGKEVGQGGLSIQGDSLYATAFRSPTDAVSPPFVGRVEDYKSFPTPLDAAAIRTEVVKALQGETKVSLAVAAIVASAIEELKGALRGALGK